MISPPSAMCSVAMSLACHPPHSRHLGVLHTALALLAASILGAGHLIPPPSGYSPRSPLPKRQAIRPPVLVSHVDNPEDPNA